MLSWSTYSWVLPNISHKPTFMIDNVQYRRRKVHQVQMLLRRMLSLWFHSRKHDWSWKPDFGESKIRGSCNGCNWSGYELTTLLTLILTFSNAYINNDVDDLHMMALKYISVLFLMLLLSLIGFQTNAPDPVCAVTLW